MPQRLVHSHSSRRKFSESRFSPSDKTKLTHRMFFRSRLVISPFCSFLEKFVIDVFEPPVILQKCYLCGKRHRFHKRAIRELSNALLFFKIDRFLQILPPPPDLADPPCTCEDIRKRKDTK